MDHSPDLILIARKFTVNVATSIAVRSPRRPPFHTCVLWIVFTIVTISTRQQSTKTTLATTIVCALDMAEVNQSSLDSLSLSSHNTDNWKRRLLRYETDIETKHGVSPEIPGRFEFSGNEMALGMDRLTVGSKALQDLLVQAANDQNIPELLKDAIFKADVFLEKSKETTVEIQEGRHRRALLAEPTEEETKNPRRQTHRLASLQHPKARHHIKIQEALEGGDHSIHTKAHDKLNRHLKDRQGTLRKAPSVL
ncbi:expressed unknown protein [Seminavis robusta]|uniref:Uncharacterized protein n=1 Tax=Seminavis robusta TaxID=568900 RepID=A0A9N8ERC9_9STRA|nr:expressed unknown protein [Seminavis robusta]|eukprot:Sro1619_g286480.1 n/a (252) ;mRNA; r:13521-14560